ncbi:MAG TPA: outer membrane beta-barrel protein [bacterium]|jgi:opacity protein-like surface antigen|nr:outer membrane beta-barrel protein [bacterium]HNT65513.1 outer membrane beta-barrel protein [bacterium]HOX87429.1 outer membrane beta-barrel protein [bacterium]HPG46890.1 outer membrane beta-barrel protein [bacterium]HPM99130.1 outer membrane beta-barrel protein [bacterium]
MKKSLIVVTALILFSGAAFAQAEIGFNGMGAKVGFVMPEDPIESTIGFGLVADLGTIMPNLALHAYVDYWGKSYDESEHYESKFSVVSIAAIAKYLISSGGSLTPYVGGGLGLEFASVSGEYTGPSVPGYTEDFDYDETETDLGIHLVGGAMMELSPAMKGFAEVKYTIGDVDYLGIFAGVIYSLK